MAPLCLFAAAALAGTVAYADIPSVEVLPPDAAVHPGTPATVTYRLTWPADGEQWRVPAPTVEQPAWGRVLLESATAYAAGENNVAEFDLGVIAPETGSYRLPALQFDVYAADEVPRNDETPLREEPAEWTTDQSVTAEPVTLTVVPDYRRWALIGVVAAGALALLAAAGWGVYRTRPAAEPEHAASDDPREHVHAARKHRLDGDFYRFFLALGAAAGKVKTPDAASLAAQHNERAREVGYGGIRPTDDEMDAALRDTERVMAADRG